MSPGADRSREHEEWLVPLPRPRAQIADATHFRSTWITASQATLRDRGLGAAYEAALDHDHKEQLLGVVAGMWLPMEVVIAHYSACDRLALPTADLLDIGNAATRRANATTLSMISRLARGAGATPWIILEQASRLWLRTCHGGAFAVAKLGPKEARCEIIGFPLAKIRYNRVTMRGIISAGIELFCTKVYVNDIPELCDDRSLGMRASWV